MFFEENAPTESIIELVVSLAAKARKNGVAALAADILEVQHRFLHKGLMLAVDGAATSEIREMMELDLKLEMSEADMDARVLESAGGYAPTIGILGAVIGLIQVMKHLDNLSQVGSGVAVAFVATIYGVGSANLIFLPLGQKMRLRAWKAMRTKHLMLEGIVSITEGVNPRLVRRRLDAFVSDGRPPHRPQSQIEPAPVAAASA
jgi:chemotaxis protein MotA